VFLARFHDSGSCREFETVIFGAYLLLGVFTISPKFRLKTPSGLGDPSIESLGLFCGLIWGGRYFRPCPKSTDNLIFSCQRVFIGSTDPRLVLPIVESTDLVPEVPITWF
jgi:hypothetical protein